MYVNFTRVELAAMRRALADRRAKLEAAVDRKMRISAHGGLPSEGTKAKAYRSIQTVRREIADIDAIFSRITQGHDNISE